MRIALVVTLSFAAIWMVALRPKPVEEPPMPAPPPVAQAKPEAKAATPEPAAKPAPAAKPEAAAKPEPSAKAATPVERRVNAVLAALDARKVVVLLFWDRNGSDDREVRRAVSGVDRKGGRVAVHNAPLRDLAGYEPITAGVPVVGTPTVLVIDRQRRAIPISGLTVTREIDQKVTKAFKASR